MEDIFDMVWNYWKSIFEQNGLHPEDLHGFEDTLSFHVLGNRNSIITYTIRRFGCKDSCIDFWMGKIDSDSGGLGGQIHIKSGVFSPETQNELRKTLKFHKRFIESGRRKVLRRHEEKRLGR